LTLRHRSWAAISDLFTGVPVDAGPLVAPTPAKADPVADDFNSRLRAQLRHHPGRLAVACLATVVAPTFVARAGSVDQGSATEVHATAGLSDDPVPVPVPGDRATWLPLARRAASTCPGLSPAVLVAIAHVESSLGLQTYQSSAGAVGPMQFLPSTWVAYGADGDGDGLTDVLNPVDAVHGAARLLCANGGNDPERLASALWNYNHSDDYVHRVIGLSRLLPVES